jgi:signal transduction histidine kinase
MAFRNILDNSLKYTENGFVEVKISEKNDEVMITFRDTGVGIPQEDLPYITERFYRANTRVEGSGLGLALVKEIVELHGGKMEIKSELGKGTIVTLFFKKLGSDSIV